jgi:predicted Zn-dependent peptidase
MLDLAFDANALEVQKKVVIEEFKEVYLNKPYGDAWLHLTQAAYTTHPYQAPVIGKAINHIEAMTMAEVKAFFQQFYVPKNAVLVVAGGVDVAQIKELSEKWFGPIPPGNVSAKYFPQEPPQSSPRHVTITRPVPLDAIYQAYHVAGRLATDFYATELISAALGAGKSSRLYQGLVVENPHLSAVNTYTTTTMDPGLLVITGQVHENISLAATTEVLQTILQTICKEGFTEIELAKAKNHVEGELTYHRVELAEKAEALAEATLLGDTNLVNTYIDSINQVTLQELNTVARKVLQPHNSTTLHYQSESLQARR